MADEARLHIKSWQIIRLIHEKDYTTRLVKVKMHYAIKGVSRKEKLGDKK